MRSWKKISTVIAACALALSMASFESPAQATAFSCTAGYYLADLNNQICNTANPGYFTADGATEQSACPLGTYTSTYKSTSCVDAAPGYYTSSTAMTTQLPCEPGTFNSNFRSISCLPASPGNYIPSSAATSQIPCPAASTGYSSTNRTSGTDLLDCYTYSANTILSPSSGSTYSESIPLQFVVTGGLSQTDQALKVVYTSGGTSIEYRGQVQPTSPKSWASNNGVQSLNLPLAWLNGTQQYGCTTSCSTDTVHNKTAIPNGTYSLDITVIRADNTSTTFTVSNVIVASQVAAKPQTYVGMFRLFKFADTVRVEGNFAELPASGSIKVTIQNAAPGGSPSSTRVITLSDSVVSTLTRTINGHTYFPGRMVDLDIPVGSSALTALPSYVVSETGSISGAGQWWIGLSYKRLSSTTEVTDWWSNPILVVRNCGIDTYSVNGIEACRQVNPGYVTTYPTVDGTGYNFTTSSFFQSLCFAGTYAQTHVAAHSTCDPAGLGSYQDLAGQITTKLCSAGTYTDEVGQLECKSARAGYYVPNSGSATEEPCPAGTYQNKPGQMLCLWTSAGHYSAASGSATQTACAAGTYQPDQQATSCIKATAGYFVSGTGKISAQQCAAGSYSSAEGQSACTAAAKGYFVSTAGATSQTACPAGTSSPEGSTSEADCKSTACMVKVKKNATESCLLVSAGQAKPVKHSLKLTVGKQFKKVCKVSGSKVKVLSAGTCTVTMTYKPKKGAKLNYTATIVGS